MCKIWQGAKDRDGYGWTRLDGKMIYAHRLAYIQEHGSIPKGLYVLHRCDTPSCYDVDCLFLGTNDENMADMVAKGRSPRGERNCKAKLTVQDVLDIRSAWPEQKISKIAREYDVQRPAIWKIVHRKTWRHI